MSRIVNEDLDHVCLKKPTAPKLTDVQVAQRKVRAKPFSLLVSGGREQYILTLDEAWISLGSSTLLYFNGWPIPLVYHRWTSLEMGG